MERTKQVHLQSLRLYVVFNRISSKNDSECPESGER
jgi:hypothetical protein